MPNQHACRCEEDQRNVIPARVEACWYDWIYFSSAHGLNWVNYSPPDMAKSQDQATDNDNDVRDHLAAPPNTELSDG